MMQEVLKLNNCNKPAYAKSAVFVSKEQAAEEHSALIGENFMEFLGDNPLKNSIDVFLLADYVTADEVENIKNELLQNNFIDSVNYDKPLIVLLNDNIKKISFWALVISMIYHQNHAISRCDKKLYSRPFCASKFVFRQYWWCFGPTWIIGCRLDTKSILSRIEHH
jgi:hypothetical protein